MIENKPHEHADLLRAIADGHHVRVWGRGFGQQHTNYTDMSSSMLLEMLSRGTSFSNWITIKPDVETFMFVEANPKLENAHNRPNLKLIFDGTTQKLKTAIVLE